MASPHANRAALPARVRQLPPATSRSASRSSPLAQIATSRARPGRPQRRHERADTKKLPREVSTGRARSVVALTARRHQALGPPRPERSQAPEPAGYSCRAARLHLTARCPARPQMSQVSSVCGQSATTCAVEPHAWHCAGSGHAPARWPTTPQLLQRLLVTPPPPPPPP